MNNHPFKGSHVVNGTLTGLPYTDTVLQVACPHCKCSAGYHCERPKGGQQVFPPHSKRIKAYRDKLSV